MEFIQQYGHQGDTQWFEIDPNTIPEDAKKVDKQFIAESERSGSCHALCGDYDMLELPEQRGFVIKTNGECVLNHTLKSNLRSMNEATTLPPKDHRSSVIPAGKTFFVGIHRRVDPLTASFENVRD
jgi:hypothetical protein